MNALAGYDTTGEPNGPTGVGDRWVRIGPLKVFLDGGMLNGTAYMREPWGVGPTYQITDPEYRGLLFVEPDVLAIVAEEAARRGWQMTAHIAGEAAMDALLDAYEQADRDRRHPGPSLADDARQLHLGRQPPTGRRAGRRRRPPAGLAPEGHADVLMKVLGPERMAWFHPYRRWLDAGRPDRRRQRPHDPARPDRGDEPLGPLARHLGRRDPPRPRALGVHEPDQALTREEALRFYTINNARLHFEERDKGTIEPGKLADLILVDRDPLTCPVDDVEGHARSSGRWSAAGSSTASPDPPRSENPVQRPPRRGQGVDPSLDLGVVHQRRGVVRLDPGVDHQRAPASPVLLIGEGADPVHVGRRVRAGERHPEQVLERPRRELAVVDQDDQREGVDRVVRPERPAEGGPRLVLAPRVRLILRRLHHQHARQADPRVVEPVRQVQPARQFRRQLAAPRPGRGDRPPSTPG